MQRYSSRENGKKWVQKVFLSSMLLVAVGGFLSWNFWFKEIWRIKDMDIGRINLSIVSDGIYRGSFETPYAVYTVDVSVYNHAITQIKQQTEGGFLTYYDRAVESIGKEVIKAQDTTVDAVSGATVSSKAVLNAIVAAIQKIEM